jgi:hypothetical protein
MPFWWRKDKLTDINPIYNTQDEVSLFCYSILFTGEAKY